MIFCFQIYLALLWVGSQSREVFWFLFIAVMILCVYVVPASKDLDEWDRLFVINHHHISLKERRSHQVLGGVLVRL